MSDSNMLNILAVNFFDDNFGDMLIGTCFRQLLRVVLKNIGVEPDNYCISRMHLKDVDEELILASDIVFFAGGGLIGLSYLGFSDSFERIIEIADRENIPVVLSSIGINNMDANDESDDRIRMMLTKDCIQAVSVRENKKFFERLTYDQAYEISEVCDPVVWVKYVYGLDRQKAHKAPIVGINVVRGGLFRDNGYDWRLTDELDYIKELIHIFEIHNVDYKLYTNGSFLDNETLKQFIFKYDLPKNKYLINRTSWQLVSALSEFDGVIAIRMHSSIIAYSFDIPSLNLIWNDKIPFFYANTKHRERAIEFKDWTPERIADDIQRLMNPSIHESAVGLAEAKDRYLMSLYDFLFETMCKLSQKKPDHRFDITEVKNELRIIAPNIDENDFDLFHYITRGENKYAELFRKSLNKTEKITSLKESIKSLKNKIAKQTDLINKRNARIDELKQKVKKKNETIEKQKSELEYLNSRVVVKAYKKIKRIGEEK